MDRRFTRAFKRYGLDLTATPMAEAVAQLKSRPEVFVREVSGSLDHWLIIRHELRSSSVPVQKLLDLRKILELGQGLDPDPERTRLRVLLMQADLKSHREYLAAMARQPKLVELGPSSALLLARLLNSAGDQNSAIAVLRSAAIRYPSDPWTNYELATILGSTDPPQADESIRFFTAARALKPETGWDLAEVLQNHGRYDEAEALLAELARLDREPTRNLFQLARLLRQRGKNNEAQAVVDRMIAPFRERVRRQPNDGLTYRRIAVLLWLSHDLKGAAAAYLDAARVDPTDAHCRRELGMLLSQQGDWPGAIAALRDAIRIDPGRVGDHYRLAAAVERSGDQTGEIAELREAIRVERLPQVPQPPAGADMSNSTLFDDCYLDSWRQGYLAGVSSNYSFEEPGSIGLGCALAESGDLPGAIEAYANAIRLGESSDQGGKAAPHAYLGNARRLTSDKPEAIAAYREAIRLEPDRSIEARYGLGVTLSETGDVPGAIAALREAIQHDHLKQPGPFRLLRVISMARQPGEAIAALRRVREQAHDDGTIGRAVDVAIRQFEQLSKQGSPIPIIFRLSFQSNNFAEHCYRRRFFAASAAIWSAGFAADAKLTQDMNAQNRYNAACSAALAAAGQGIDKPTLDEAAKTGWRRQALAWLRADLTYWATYIERGDPKNKAQMTGTLKHWESDRDLAGVRDEAQLAKLPEREQKEWQRFWSEVAALFNKAEKP